MISICRTGWDMAGQSRRENIAGKASDRTDMDVTPPQTDAPDQARKTIFSIEFEVLAAVGAIAGALFIFLLIANGVSDGGLRDIDEQILLSLRSTDRLDDPIGPIWFEELVRDITALGSTGVLTMLVLGVSGFLLLTGRRKTAFSVIAFTAAGTLVSHLTKLGFARPRPDLVPHAAEIYTASFPSGHAMLSAVVYLTLGALIAGMQDDRRVKTYVMAFAVALTLMVGASRVYLGVHWPTDVIAGWALGAAWVAACWLIYRRLNTNGQTPRDD